MRISDWSSDVCSSDLRVAVVLAEAPLGHLAVQCDLDIDLIVRAVDARAIVDEVGVDPAALRREGDARGLRDAKVRALADRLDAQILGIDAQRVVRGVAEDRRSTRLNSSH